MYICMVGETRTIRIKILTGLCIRERPLFHRERTIYAGNAVHARLSTQKGFGRVCGVRCALCVLWRATPPEEVFASSLFFLPDRVGDRIMYAGRGGMSSIICGRLCKKTIGLKWHIYNL